MLSDIPRPRGPRPKQNYFDDGPSREEEDDALIAVTLIAAAVVSGVSYGVYKGLSWGYSYFMGSKKSETEIE